MDPASTSWLERHLNESGFTVNCVTKRKQSLEWKFREGTIDCSSDFSHQVDQPTSSW